jgi:predicted N-acetyltransferase YhbS
MMEDWHMTEPGIDDFEIRSITASEFQATLDFQQRIFYVHDMPRQYPNYFENLDKRDPYFRRENVFVALKNGKIVSHVQVFPKLIRVGKAYVWMGGVGGVATDPEYRRRGLASRLMRKSLEYMNDEGLETSLLFGDPEYYRRFGYEVAAPASGFRVDSKREVRWPNGYSWRKFEREDMDEVMGIYDQVNEDRTLSVVRSKETWLRQLDNPISPANEDTEGFTVVEGSSGVLAYARFSKRCPEGPEGEEGYAIECGAKWGEGVLQALHAAIVAYARAKGLGQIYVSLPADDPFASFLLEVGAVRTYSRDTGTQLCIVSFRELFIRLEEELTRRISSMHGRIGRRQITISTDSGDVSLEVIDDKVRVLDDPEKEISIKTDGHVLAQIITGFVGPTEAVRQGSAVCGGEDLEVLEALFPKGEPHIWYSDAF